jgi:starch-binding outer membrane protein, SusD/RagB family
MKRIKFNILYIIGSFALLTSCTDDLNITPEDDDVFLTDGYFNTPSSYKTGLGGVYANLSLTGLSGPGSSNISGLDPGTSQFGRCLWYLQTLTTDEVIWSYENDPGTAELQRNTWTSNNPIILGMYSRTMAQVAFCNEYLRQTTPAKLSGRGVTDPTLLAEIALYREEVRALRAYAYYNIMDLYGKAAFNTENDGIGVAGPEYNRQQLFGFIESEMLAVAQNLKAPRTNEYGRIDKAFAWMVLAKIYLNAEVYIGQNKYDQCVTMCENVIGGGYTLENNYLHNFTADNHLSSEMIFTLQADGNVTQNFGPTTVMCNGQVGSIENNGSSFGVGGWGGALRLRKQFVEKFADGSFSSDERKTIISGSRPIDIASIANQAQGFILAKYSNISSTGVAGPNQTFVDTDFPLFRLADAYLMYAECARRGATNANLGQAVFYINSLRERANNSSANNIDEATMTLDFLLDERARELHWEAHRRQDLIRFGKYVGGNYNWAWKGNGSNGIAIPNHFKLFPIPSNSLSANPNLTQNTGY